MQFQLIFRNARRDRFELRACRQHEPTLEGQVLADGAVVAIYGRLWRATQLETRDVTRFIVVPADSAPELK